MKENPKNIPNVPPTFEIKPNNSILGFCVIKLYHI